MVNINIVADTAKLGIFFVSLAFLAVSCENNRNDVIPDVYVDFTMDLRDIEFTKLTTTFGSVYINANTNNWGQRASGYNNNGIIVFAGSDIDYYAFDRTCPHDYSVDQSSVKVNVDFVQAICPKCSTVYELSAGGVRSKGPGKYQLKNYRTYFDGRFLRVWNY